MRLLFLFLFIFLTSGCYTNAVAINEAKTINNDRVYAYQEENDSVIVIVRDSGVFAHFCTVDFYIDGVLAAGFNPSEIAKFNVKEGKHNLSIRACGEPNTVNININKGEILKYRIYIGGASFKLIKI